MSATDSDSPPTSQVEVPDGASTSHGLQESEGRANKRYKCADESCNVWFPTRGSRDAHKKNIHQLVVKYKDSKILI
jgi:hypothetical protein